MLLKPSCRSPSHLASELSTQALQDLFLGGFCMAVMGFRSVEDYLLKWGNGICREVKGRPLGFLVVEELPLEALTECHGPWL